MISVSQIGNYDFTHLHVHRETSMTRNQTIANKSVPIIKYGHQPVGINKQDSKEKK